MPKPFRKQPSAALKLIEGTLEDKPKPQTKPLVLSNKDKIMAKLGFKV